MGGIRYVSEEDMFADMVTPGAVWLTTGFKGGGKSHTAIAVCERLVEGRFPKVGKVFLLTNIIFLKRYAGDRYEVEAPENVTHVETMEQTFREIGRLLREYGRDIKIILVLDEAQNFISGDSNFSNASIMMKEFLGTIRKYRLIIWFLTPSKQSIGPAFRNWLNDLKYPGNLTAQWKKDLAWNQDFIQKHRLVGVSPKQLMVVKNYDSKARVVQVPVTPWTRTKEEIGVGDYCYDHEASATFYVGDGFDWEDFNRRLGGVPSTRIVETIEEYFHIQAEKAEEAAQDAPIMDAATKAMLDAAVKLRESTDWSWQRIADTVAMPRKTLTDRLHAAGRWRPEWDKQKGSSVQQECAPVQQKSPSSSRNVLRQNHALASNFGGGRIGGSKTPAIYISRTEGAERGPPAVEASGNNGGSGGGDDALPSSSSEGSPVAPDLASRLRRIGPKHPIDTAGGEDARCSVGTGTRGPVRGGSVRRAPRFRRGREGRTP